MTRPRPQSLAEVAERATDAPTFEFELADFLHEFARSGSAEMLAVAPAMLVERLELGHVYDAYLAAVAVHLAGKRGVPAPRWSREPGRILREPWFANPSRHMRALWLVESPAEFRERNLFVTENAVSVA